MHPLPCQAFSVQGHPVSLGPPPAEPDHARLWASTSLFSLSTLPLSQLFPRPPGLWFSD